MWCTAPVPVDPPGCAPDRHIAAGDVAVPKPEDARGSALDLVKAGDHLGELRLAVARNPCDTQDLARVNLQAHLAESSSTTVARARHSLQRQRRRLVDPGLRSTGFHTGGGRGPGGRGHPSRDHLRGEALPGRIPGRGHVK